MTRSYHLTATAFFGAFAIAGALMAEVSPPASSGFVESPVKPGVFFPLAPSPSAAEGLSARGEIPVTQISGMNIPGPVVQDGNLLYVGNTADNNANLVSIVDISTYGSEVVVGTIDTPVNPVDTAVRDGVIYVIDQARTPLWYKPLDADEWSSIDLPNAVITEWTYGDIIYPHPAANKILVIHMWEDLIDVVNMDTAQVEHVISELDYCPTRLIFTDDYMLVVSTCLNAPSCLAFGPSYSVFDLNTFELIFKQDISGEDCAYALANIDDSVYVSFLNRVKTYDLLSGTELDEAQYPQSLNRHIETDGESLFIQFYNGNVRKLNADLSAVDTVNVLEGPQGWSPPLEEMVVMPPSDGRLFVTNRDEDSLSVAYFPPTVLPCDGDVNGDNVVDPLDSGYVLARVGCAVGTGDPACDAADANLDSLVDPLDVGYVLSRLGECP